MSTASWGQLEAAVLKAFAARIAEMPREDLERELVETQQKLQKTSLERLALHAENRKLKLRLTHENLVTIIETTLKKWWVENSTPQPHSAAVAAANKIQTQHLLAHTNKEQK